VAIFTGKNNKLSLHQSILKAVVCRCERRADVVLCHQTHTQGAGERADERATKDEVTRKKLHHAVVLTAGTCALSLFTQSVRAQRVLGLDISTYQGDITQATFNDIHNLENRQFIIIRSSRGGNHRRRPSPGRISLRQQHAAHVVRALRRSVLRPEHHPRHRRRDACRVVSLRTPMTFRGTPGTDEANHFMQMAGAWMRPGYMLPVYDLEGPALPTSDQQAQYAIDFLQPHQCGHGHQAVHVHQWRLLDDHGRRLAGRWRNQLVAAYPNLWDARLRLSGSQYNSPAVQTAHPKDTASSFTARGTTAASPIPVLLAIRQPRSPAKLPERWRELGF